VTPPNEEACVKPALNAGSSWPCSGKTSRRAVKPNREEKLEAPGFSRGEGVTFSKEYLHETFQQHRPLGILKGK